MNKLDYRAIQIGLSGIAVQKYVDEWIVDIADINPLRKTIHSIISKNTDEAIEKVPKEKRINFYLF